MGASLDPILVMREFIQTSAASAYTQVSGRIYGHTVVQQNFALPAITIDIQTGRSDPQVPIYNPAVFIVRVWAPKQQNSLARSVYGLLRDGLHGKTHVTTTTGHIIYCHENQPGQDLTDFDTEIASVLSYWSVAMYATAT